MIFEFYAVLILCIFSLFYMGRTGAGRVRELTTSSRSKFKMIWHQLSTVQFSSHQFVWKVHSVHLMGASNFKTFNKFSSRFTQLCSVQFDVQFSGTPDGVAFGIGTGARSCYGTH